MIPMSPYATQWPEEKNAALSDLIRLTYTL